MDAINKCAGVLGTVPLLLSVKQGSYKFYKLVIDLILRGIKPESTAPEADTLTTRPSEVSPSFACRK